MDMSAIAGVIIFSPEGDDELPFQIHQLRLVLQEPHSLKRAVIERVEQFREIRELLSERGNPLAD